MNLPNPKLLTLRQAVQARRRLQRLRGKFVLTNGVFDLLHPGHTSYLEQARRLAGRRGRLFVALNSDRSVRQLKGPLRPILDEKSRAYNLAQLRSVDGIVIFTRRRLATTPWRPWIRRSGPPSRRWARASGSCRSCRVSVRRR